MPSTDDAGSEARPAKTRDEELQELKRLRDLIVVMRERLILEALERVRLKDQGGPT